MIKIQLLTQATFAPFGDVIETQASDFFYINDHQTQRHHALSHVTALGEVGISLFQHLQKTSVPFSITMLERHPKGSQAFIPMHNQPFLVVVAHALNKDTPNLNQICAFITNGKQGVNYHQGTWHHPLLTLNTPSLFTVVDRITPDPNCDVYNFNDGIIIAQTP